MVEFAEYSTRLGEWFKPREIMEEKKIPGSSLVVGLETNGPMIQFKVSFQAFSLERTDPIGVSTLNVHTYSPNIRRTIKAEELESLKGLCLKVRMPTGLLCSYEDLEALHGSDNNSSIRFRFFGKAEGSRMPTFHFQDFTQRLKEPINYLPALVIPSGRTIILEEEQIRGVLALNSFINSQNTNTQRVTEIQFDLLDPSQIPSVQYNWKYDDTDTISIEWGRKNRWENKDWSLAFKDLSEQTLMKIYRELSSKIMNSSATVQEIDYVLTQLLKTSSTFDRQTIARNVYLFQVSQADWLYAKLFEGPRPIA